MANITERKVIEYSVELTNEEKDAFQTVINLLVELGHNDVEIKGWGDNGEFLYHEMDLIDLSNQLSEILIDSDTITYEDKY